MPVCPNCQTELETVRQHDGVYFSCPKCGGHALTIPRITTLSGAEFSAKLLRKINVGDSFGLHKCPFCEHEMLRFMLEDPPLGLEACHKCNLVWFGKDEFQHIPIKVAEPVHVTPQPIAEAIAVYHNQELQARLDLESPPDAAWKTVPAILGLPVECDTTPLDRPPWATWILSATILVFSILAFFNLRDAIDSFGFVPADAFRYGGLTFLTSFFVHGGIWHLVGNLYFLLIFGRKVENVLGPQKFCLLVLASTVVGDCVHLLLQFGSLKPCIGASGGISGIIVFYALQFPRQRLGFLVSSAWRWLEIPAWVALVLWLILQSGNLLLQLSGASNVASTAHLGGSLAGAAIWWWRRKSKPQPV